MPSTLDDRTFESATTPTPEEQLATAAHFEAKGYEVEVVPEEGDAPAAPPVVESDPPAAVVPDSVPVVEEIPLDAESQAEWQSANNDGEKKGKYAKRTKQIHELKATVSEKDAEIERLRTELAAKGVMVSGAPDLAPPVSVVPPPPTPQPEAQAPIKAREFDKPRPVRPKFEDFAASDDPHAEFAAAGMDYAEKITTFDSEKRAFDDTENRRVQTETQQQEQQRTRKAEQDRNIKARFDDAVREHPDFAAKTANIPWPSVARYLMQEELPNGFKLGYKLAQPENAQILSELIAKYPETNDPAVALKQLNEARADLAVIQYRLNQPAPAPPETTVVATPPAQPPTPPSNPPPRREEAAPVPVRGHGAPALRPEDVAPMDSDARRALRGMASAVRK